MSDQFDIISSPTPSSRRQPLLAETLTPARKSSSNIGEVAGVTTANCFVVCCCCPCVLVEFILLAVYKVPVNLGRRVWRKQRSKMMTKKRKKKGLLEQAKEGKSGESEVYHKKGGSGCVHDLTDMYRKELEMIKVSADGSAVELDRKMWEQFNDAGFWRSSSQRNS